MNAKNKLKDLELFELPEWPNIIQDMIKWLGLEDNENSWEDIDVISSSL